MDLIIIIQFSILIYTFRVSDSIIGQTTGYRICFIRQKYILKYIIRLVSNKNQEKKMLLVRFEHDTFDLGPILANGG